CTGKDKEDAGEKEPAKETGKENTEETTEEDPAEEDASAGLDFPFEVSNKAEAIEDGEMTIAMVTDTPFEGTLAPVFYSGAYDWEV
ncbi:hypothetical protein, partial [Escherichia coli]|uniref:hypothetical protein n=1 Tax=Escherichia coli TaxID=562 RepID=UPI001CCAD190